MVSLIEACRIGSELGKLWTKSVKSGNPNEGSVAASPRRVLSSTRKWAANTCAKSSGAREVERARASIRESSPSPIATVRRLAVFAPGVFVSDPAVGVGPGDGVEHETDFLQRRLLRRRR